MKHQLLHLIVRRTMCLAALLTIFCVWAHAENYKLEVGGKTVSSSNASNVTGDNIKPYFSSVNSGKASVTYDASTKTLTLYNVKIDRTGEDNRAILNEGIDGLTVILKGRNYLKATDSSPLRFNAKTYLKSEMANNSNLSEIIGGNEDAITVGNDAILYIDNANLDITSNSSAFEAATTSEMLQIIDSKVTATCEAYKKDDCYAVNGFESLTICNSDVKLTGYKQAVYNVYSATLSDGAYVKEPFAASFAAIGKTFNAVGMPTIKTLVFARSPKINPDNFPDEVFRVLVKTIYDTNEDGYLNPSDEGDIQVLNVSGFGISYLKGIEYFPFLQKLDCSKNNITHLNVSQNTQLTVLHCEENQLVQLVVTGCTELTHLYCHHNQLQNLDVSKQTKLQWFECYNNKLTSLNLENNTKLTTLSCPNNKLTNLQIKECKSLDYLNVYNNKFNIDNITGLLSNLPTVTNKELLFCKALNSSTDNTMSWSCVKLAKTSGWTVKMQSGNTWIDYPGSDATVINTDNFPDANFRTYVSSNFDSTSDGYLNADERNAVKDITVDSKNISSLQGVELFKNLTKLECKSNKLQTLDVSNNKELKELHCANNKLTSLTVINNKKLMNLYIEGNSIKGTAMDDLISSLPTMAPSTYGVMHVFNSENTTNNEMTYAQVKATKKKAWYVLHWISDGWVNYPGSDAVKINETNFPDENFRAYVGQKSIDADQDGFLNQQEIADVTSIDVYNLGITSLKGIDFFTALTEQNCSCNSLTSLDVSNNTALTKLSCESNSLTALDVSKSTALTELNCGWNSLTALDVSNNTLLTYLSCSSNSLTSLDVSSNTALTELQCYGNAIRGAGMTTLVNSLPETEDPRKLYVYYNETPAGNWITVKQVENAEKNIG